MKKTLNINIGSRDIVKRFIGIFIAILLLGYGVVRMGVGASLLAQTLDIVNFPDLAEGVAEVKLFIDARANYQILPFSLNGYFGYILAMGVLLSAGAGGVIARAQRGIQNSWCLHGYARCSLC